MNQDGEDGEPTSGRSVSNLKLSPVVSILLCSWAQIGEPLWSGRKSRFWGGISYVRYNLIENFLRVKSGQWLQCLNYHVSLEALKFHSCFFCLSAEAAPWTWGLRPGAHLVALRLSPRTTEQLLQLLSFKFLFRIMCGKFVCKVP